MESFNYDIIFEQAMQRIRNIRRPHAKRADNENLGWDTLEEQVIFDFGGKEAHTYYHAVESAKKISISCISAIIEILADRVYGRNIELISECLDIIDNPCFVLLDNQKKDLFIFREIEKVNFWKTEDEPINIQNFMKEKGAKKCQYIYFVYDYAYLQVIGYNNDKEDQSRGTRLYSLMDFFDFYFSRDERVRFEKALHEYIEKVNECLGYILVKSLTSNTLINFRNITENFILRYDFSTLIDKKINSRFVMDKVDYKILSKQFFDEKCYQIIIGDSDFAESIITAEWLFDSMKKAKAIDLTIIGMGYFKAIEQLLFELIKVHMNEKDVEEKDFTIGAIATYYKKNMKSIFRDELQFFTKTFIKEVIFEFADLRNGYFHKHNIREWDKIDEIRNTTFELVFLVLSAHKLTDEKKRLLGLPDKRFKDDYYKLCEYMNYHAGDVFFIQGQSVEKMYISCGDSKQRIIADRYIDYSGIYLKEIGASVSGVINKNSLPRKITIGKLVPTGRNEVQLKPVKIKIIFEEGKFVGPSIVEEEGLAY